MARQIMRLICCIIFSFLMAACSELIDPPKNLLTKDEMAQVIAELAATEQLNNYVPGTNIENATRVVLKQKKIKAADIAGSYTYYMASGELDKILEDAQQIILEKDPKAAEYIHKKIIENKNAPVLEK